MVAALLAQDAGDATGHTYGFQVGVTGGSTNVPVDVSTMPGSATLVYQVDRTNGVITMTQQDITSSAGLAAFTNGLSLTSPIRVAGVPTRNGHIRAYAVTYFTGDIPQ